MRDTTDWFDLPGYLSCQISMHNDHGDMRLDTTGTADEML